MRSCIRAISRLGSRSRCKSSAMIFIATYSLHHLTDDAKAVFLSGLREQLNEGGKILIGDVAFETRAELEACREAAGADWDEDEIYFVASELREKLPGLTFARISSCAGVLTLARTEE